MTKADQLARALDEFLALSPEVEAAAVVSADGLPMASALPAYVEEERLAAMSAALLTLGERAASGLGKGALGQVFIEGAHGHVILMAAGEGAVLVAMAARDSKIGLVLFEMRRAAGRIASIMDRGSSLESVAPNTDVGEANGTPPSQPAREGDSFPAAPAPQPAPTDPPARVPSW